MRKLGFLLLLLCLFYLFSSVRSSSTVRKRHYVGLEAAPWRTMTLTKDFTFPLPDDLTKKVRLTGLHEVFANQSNSSLGCILSRNDWYDNAPASFCLPEELKRVFIFSQQRSGTSLLAKQMSELPSVLPLHEPFCCEPLEDESCENREKGVLNIPKVICSLGFGKVGIRTLAIGLQKSQFWKNMSMAYNTATQNNIPAIFLVRQNTLARRLSTRGFSSHSSYFSLSQKSTLTRKDIVGVIADSRSQEGYGRLYCSLKRARIPTYFTTYEILNKNFSETMLDVAQILIGKREGPWRGTATPSAGHKNRTLISKIENVEEVRGWLRELSPERECYLDENCVFSGVPNCSDPRNTVLESQLPERERSPYEDPGKIQDSIYLTQEREDLAKLKELKAKLDEFQRIEEKKWGL